MKVLHIENSVFIRKIVEEIVLDSGMEYVHYCNEIDVLDMDRSFNADIVITALENVDTEILDSYNLLERHIGEETLILVITGKDSLEVRQKLFRAGIVDYIVKDQIFRRRLQVYLDTFRENRMSDMLLHDKRVSILDDSSSDLKVIDNLLRKHGVGCVQRFNNYEEMLANPFGFDVYIVDFELPGTASEVLIRDIKEQCPNAIIILVTSSGNYIAVSHLLMLDADDCIFKPFSSHVFLARLKNQLRINEAMTLLNKQKDELENLLHHDHLTGIKNRRSVMSVLHHAVSDKRSCGNTTSVIMIDIDDFKSINDSCGHIEGDRVLCEVAKTISSSTRECDAVGRYGGEEFLVVLPDTPLNEACTIAQNIRKNIEDLSLKDNMTVTISGGVATSGDGLSIHQLLKKADENLYIAKNRGKNFIAYEGAQLSES